MRSGRAAAFALPWIASACTLVSSFDGYDPIARPELYAVSGLVDGLETGTATLRLNAGYSLDVSNGPFAFPAVLLDGSGYVVTAEPSVTTLSCAVTSGSGTIAGANATDVAVHCASNDATLAALSLSRGALVPTFDPATHAYQLDRSLKTSIALFQPTTLSVTATVAHAGAALTIDKAPAVSGSPTTLPVELGTRAIHVGVTAADGTVGTDYVIDVTGYVNEYVKASNTRTGAGFGGPTDGSDRAVAVDGDTMVVSSPLEASSALGIDGDQTDTSVPGAGAVYVFVNDNGTWSQQAYIKPPPYIGDCHLYDGRFMSGGGCDPAIMAHFGSAVAISGDTLVVGAPNQPSQYASAYGFAYVYVRNGSTWAWQAILAPWNVSDAWPYHTGAEFGASVAIDGDTIAVGAPFEEYGAGAVYVFTHTNGQWGNGAFLKASNAIGSFPASFGADVALRSGTLAVGAPGEASSATGINGNQSDLSAPGAGAVYVFSGGGSTWSQDAYVKASNTTASASFGATVTLSVSGDTLATQTTHDVYVFQRNGTWSQEADIALAGADGVALSPLGDALAVGVPSDASNATGIDGDATDLSATSAGAVRVFARTGSTWPQRAYVKASNTRKNALFGRSLALSPTILVVGAPGESSGATGINGDQSNGLMPRSGAVYVY